MRPFIYGKRNLIHIIDLKETLRGLLRAYRFLAKVAIRGYSKKMVATLNRELSKITRNLQGIREMNRLPDAMVVVDPKREEIAVKEAKRMGVTTVALIDTDSDPDSVDLPIPGNDDSIRSIEILLAKVADAVLEGKAALPPEPPSQPRGRPASGAGQPAPAANPKP